jgi:hypothetical protein
VFLDNREKGGLPFLFSIGVVIGHHIVSVQFNNLLQGDKDQPRSLLKFVAKNLPSHHLSITFRHFLSSNRAYIPRDYTHIQVKISTVLIWVDFVFGNVVAKECCYGFGMLSL